MSPDHPEDLLVVTKAAKRLDASTDYIYREIAAGRMQAMRFGKRGWRVPIREVNRYIVERLTPPPTNGNHRPPADGDGA
jgi:excisionase family DNA binding protein